MKTKHCPKCNITKSINEFYKSKQTKDGLKGWCKECCKVSNRAREHKYNETRRRYRVENREEYRANKRKYYANNKDKVLESNKAWWQTPKGRFTSYRRSAKERGLKFNLSMEQFMVYWQKPCYYCNDPIDTIGLDRINSNLNYEINNILPCCTVCNKMKLDSTQSDFFDKILQIVKHRGLR